MSGQTPSVGRIVLVPMDPRGNNGQHYAPAIITRVWSDTMVNLRVFADSSDAPIWRTSAALAEDTGAHVEGEPVANTWAWPTRV